jgi:hypothetical protein
MSDGKQQGAGIAGVAAGDELCVDGMVRSFGWAFRVRDENPTKEAHVHDCRPPSPRMHKPCHTGARPALVFRALLGFPPCGARAQRRPFPSVIWYAPRNARATPCRKHRGMCGGTPSHAPADSHTQGENAGADWSSGSGSSAQLSGTLDWMAGMLLRAHLARPGIAGMSRSEPRCPPSRRISPVNGCDRPAATIASGEHGGIGRTSHFSRGRRQSARQDARRYGSRSCSTAYSAAATRVVTPILL